MQAERWADIVETVRRSGRITVTDICDRFGISEMTARRDLAELDRVGLLRRVHGGAIASLGRSYEPPYQTRSAMRGAAKRAIGHRAAEMVVDGDSIGLDIGTTTLEIVSGLSDKHNLTIVTASLPIANAVVSQLALGTDVRLILAGGVFRAGELSMIGPIPALTFQNLHVDKAFIAVGGLSLEDGLTDFNLEDAEVKRPLLHNAQHKIVVADGSKLGRTTFASIGPLSLVDTVVTDQSAPPETVQGLQQMGIAVVVVEADCAD